MAQVSERGSIELSELTLEDVNRGRAGSFDPNVDELPEGETSDASGGDDEVQQGNSGTLGAGFNFINSIVGAGIIGLAFAVQECGLGMGIFLLVFVAWLTFESVAMIIGCGVHVRRRSYESLCEFCYGSVGFKVVSLFMLIFAFGAMCAYLLIIGDTVPVVIQHAFGKSFARETVIVVFAVFIILPLCLLRDMAALSWSSSVSILADAVIVVLVLIRAPVAAREMEPGLIDDSTSFANPKIFAGLGAISFAYVCQHSSFIVFNTLRVPTVENWRTVNVGSILSAFVMSIALALGGYLNFYNVTEANVLKNFFCDDGVMNLARFLLALTMVLTFPMEQFVARHSLFALVHGVSPKLEGPRRMSNFWHYALTIGLWTGALIVGLTIPDLALVIEVTGSLGASVLGYILPPLCYFKIYSFKGLREKSKNAWRSEHHDYKTSFSGRCRASSEFFMPLFMLIFGIVAMFAGTFTSLHQASRKSAPLCISRNITT